MFPENVLSSIPVPDYYLYPDNLDPNKTIDYEMGGVALNDPTQGLTYQVWKLRLGFVVGTRKTNVYLSAENTPEFVLFSFPGISEISLAFDQNMNPFVAFYQFGQARYWWYDPVVGGQIFSDLPAGSGPPKCCLDDKREMQTGVSDIVLCYKREGNLYIRNQRDRYTIEYLLAASVPDEVIRLGMNLRYRVQIALGVIDDPPIVVNLRTATGGRRRKIVGGSSRRLVGVSYG